MHSIKRVLACGFVAAASLSTSAFASLVEYQFSADVAVAFAPILGFTPASGAAVDGSLSYFAPGSFAGSPVNVIDGGSGGSKLYVYDMPPEAAINFTIGDHQFTSSSVSMVVRHPASAGVGMPDGVAFIGKNLTMDGASIAKGMIGLEFAYSFGSLANGAPPQELTLNPSMYSMAYIVQNGDYGTSGLFKTPGAPASTTNAMLNLKGLISPVPEPGTAALMLLGLGAMAGRGTRRPALVA